MTSIENINTGDFVIALRGPLVNSVVGVGNWGEPIASRDQEDKSFSGEPFEVVAVDPPFLVVRRVVGRNDTGMFMVLMGERPQPIFLIDTRKYKLKVFSPEAREAFVKAFSPKTEGKGRE